MKGLILVLFTAIVAFLSNNTMAQELTDPYEIVNRHLEAVGGLDQLKAQKTRHIKGELDLVGTGLKGTFEEWSEFPVKNRQEVDLKVIKQISGDDGEKGWIVDRNGKLQIRKDEKSLTDRKLEILRAEYDHFDPNSKVFTLTFGGTDTASGKDCYAIELTNNLNSDTTINYYDTSDFMLIKTVINTPEGKSEIWFSDYRKIDSTVMAYRQDMVQTPPGMRQVIEFTEAEVNKPVDESLFNPPGQDVKDFRFTNGKSAGPIPFKFIENHIYLPVEVGGKTRLWVLDTGAGATTIEEKFAKELGLKLEGKVKGQGAGNTVDVSFATLPAFNLQGLEFDEQSAAVIKLDWLFKRWLGIEVAGILGYDFLSRLVTRVDYANQTLTFYEPDSFNYSGGGVVLSTPVNERNMMDLPITVDGKYEGKWSLDLGAGSMAFFYPYAKEHGLLDAKGIDGMGFGAGGSHPNKRILANTMELGGFKVNDIEITIPVEKGQGAFGNSDLTGNIGNNFMRNFVIYIDYKKGQVILEKGDDFGKPIPRDNSGMQVSWIGQDSVQVFFIAENTPAAKAGFEKDDLIESVNGIKVKNLGGMVAIYDLLRQEPGTKLKFEIARGNETKNLTMTLADLF